MILIASIVIVGCKPPLLSSEFTADDDADADSVANTNWVFVLNLKADGSITLVSETASKTAYLKSIEIKSVEETSVISVDKEHYSKPFVFQKIHVVDTENKNIVFSKGDVYLGKPTTGSALSYEEACEFEKRGEYDKTNKICQCADEKTKVSVAEFLKFTEPKALCPKPSTATTTAEKNAAEFKKSCELFSGPPRLPGSRVQYNSAYKACHCEGTITTTNQITLSTYMKYDEKLDARVKKLEENILKMECKPSETTEETTEPIKTNTILDSLIVE